MIDNISYRGPFLVEWAPTPPGVIAGVVLRASKYAIEVSFSAVGTTSLHDARTTCAAWCAQLEIEPSARRSLRQVHGNVAIRRTAAADDAAHVPVGDAQWTTDDGVLLDVGVADCCPVIVWHPDAGLAAAIHCGWRGAAARVVERTIIEMSAASGVDPQALYAWIGPCADPELYEVGPEVAAQFREFPEALRPTRRAAEGKSLLDVRAVAARQAVMAGLPRASIAVSSGRTMTDARYHSYRRDHQFAGRMSAFVLLAQS